MQEISGFSAVRAAARDFVAYSSDLQGDRDVRTYRQLPLEADPPAHHKYRSAINPLFVRKTIDGYIPELQAVAADVVSDFLQAAAGEVVLTLALPMVVRSLGVIYNRPQDVAEWLSWGADVWSTPRGRSSERLDAYLPRVFDEAEAAPTDDVWSYVSQIQIDGRPLTRVEMYGYANVLLAGGRDTVVKLLAGALWHLGTYPEDRSYLRDRPEAMSLAIAELLRYLSPLPRMERAPAHVAALPEADRDPQSDYVMLSFVSGNHDSDVFACPDVIDIRRPRSMNLAFGAGPHTCIGNHVAEVEAKVFITEFLKQVPDWRVDPRSELRFSDIGDSQYLERIDSLYLDLKP